MSATHPGTIKRHRRIDNLRAKVKQSESAVRSFNRRMGASSTDWRTAWLRWLDRQDRKKRRRDWRHARRNA